MTEAILEHETLIGTDARADSAQEEPSHEVSARPSKRIRQAWLQRDLAGYTGSVELITASGEHSAQLTKGLHVLAIPPARFDITDPSGSSLSFHIYVPQETWTVPRSSIYSDSDSEPEYFSVGLADPVRQAKARLTTRDDAAKHHEWVLRTTSFWTEEERHYRRFRDALVCALDEDPIEDGMQHPADELIERALHTSGSRCIEELARAFREFYTSRPVMSALILRCMARIDFADTGPQGLALAKRALSHDDVEMREAAIRAFENWGGFEALAILRQHYDHETWLREYVSRVIEDLAESTS